MIKYLDYKVVFKEHPEHISLLFQITNCKNRCDGCHTPELWNDVGEHLTPYTLIHVISRYKSLISNVIFFGGERDSKELLKLLQICKHHGLKTTVWCGCDEIDPSLLEFIDYLKLGRYNKEKGGLDSPTTNQQYFEVVTGREIKIG